MLALLLLGCGSPDIADAPLTDADRHAIQAAAARWVIDETTASGVACLAVDAAEVDGDDPDIGAACEDAEGDASVLLATLLAEDRPAVPRDECGGEALESAAWVTCSVVEATGEEASVVRVGCPGEPEDGRVAIAVSFNRCDLHAAGYSCTLRRGLAGWEIELCTTDWMA